MGGRELCLPVCPKCFTDNTAYPRKQVFRHDVYAIAYCSVIWGHLTDIVHLTGVSEVIDTFVPNDSCKVFRNVSLLYLFK